MSVRHKGLAFRLHSLEAPQRCICVFRYIKKAFTMLNTPTYVLLVLVTALLLACTASNLRINEATTVPGGGAVACVNTTVVPTDDDATGLTVLWRFQGGTEPDGELDYAAVAAGDTVYTAARSRGQFCTYALDAATGAVRWQHGAVSDAGGSHGPFVSEGTVYVGAANSVDGLAPGVSERTHALDAATGQELWTGRSMSKVFENKVYTSSYNILDARTGIQQGAYSVGEWSLDREIQPTQPLAVGYDKARMGIFDLRTGEQRWAINIGPSFQPQGTIVSDTVYMQYREDARVDIVVIRAMALETGQEQWRTELVGSSYATGNNYTFTLDGDTLYLAGRPQLLALDAATGNVRWKWGSADAPNHTTSRPVVADETVYIVNQGRLYALDKRTGEEQWHSDQATLGFNVASYDGIMYANGVVYVYDRNEPEIYAFAADNGRELGHFRSELADCRRRGVSLRADVIHMYVECTGADRKFYLYAISPRSDVVVPR